MTEISDERIIPIWLDGKVARNPFVLSSMKINPNTWLANLESQNEFRLVPGELLAKRTKAFLTVEDQIVAFFDYTYEKQCNFHFSLLLNILIFIRGILG